jgi:catechol 2,3-dioxygenase-like lactoylglutathione lyase family enzyme
MKRFHVHVGVADLERSILFYSGLFGAEPSVRKPDYAKWMIDEPRVNFAISQRGAPNIGVNHLGLQAESGNELAAIRDRFEAADKASLVDEPNVKCCYARGNKHWVTDPQGIAWEAFHTLASVPFYTGAVEAQVTAESCCGPAADSESVAHATTCAGTACCD